MILLVISYLTLSFSIIVKINPSTNKRSALLYIYGVTSLFLSIIYLFNQITHDSNDYDIMNIITTLPDNHPLLRGGGSYSSTPSSSRDLVAAVNEDEYRDAPSNIKYEYDNDNVYTLDDKLVSEGSIRQPPMGQHGISHDDNQGITLSDGTTAGVDIMVASQQSLEEYSTKLDAEIELAQAKLLQVQDVQTTVTVDSSRPMIPIISYKDEHIMSEDEESKLWMLSTSSDDEDGYYA
jgi:hypothetical protein